MYNRISDLSANSSLPGEPSRPVDNDSFTRTLADLARRRDLPSGELPDKMGCCASTPHTWDPGSPNPSSPAGPSTSSPARPSTSVFEYRTAELPHANVDGICVGLTAEWFRNLPNSPRSRMNALTPGSQGHDAAGDWQQRYLDVRRSSRNEGAEPSDANHQARTTVLREADLKPSAKQNVYAFDEPRSFSSMLKKITKDGSKNLLSLGFAEGDRHTIATSVSDGRTTLFDPNYGEFTVQSDQTGSLFQSLANRYRNPNGLHLSTVTTQKID
ncbi:C58 family peptidase [Mesorhizobium caraganae]|uniref:YopT-type cysteine protease domain-containing protein n=1 Tax=Mesorhizobium caraganae TaxID=483206 RepID=UPI00193ADDBD|nr:YopT-type cysteine protease domain-containing protein [Mesorhizobium caraganae]MBM2715249.1 C58 family peptidase [Mesorhizobium caraganae]